MNKKFLATAVGVMIGAYGVGMVEAAVPENTPDNNAGIQLNRTLDYLQRSEEAKRIMEGKEKQKNLLKQDQKQKTEEQGADITITLRKIVTDPSQVLTDEELNSICNVYENKDVTVKQLYEIVDKINDLYSGKGYLTCRAFLTQQTIADGTVKITLIEGKTGNVEIVGNKFTKEKYITNRLHLVSGEVANINTLNKDLLRFNATNDAQLRIVMQAGKEPGTTDYVLQTYEPKQDNINVFMDNNGNEGSGQYRLGAFYTVKSLSGERDSLTVGSIFSEGTKAASGMYNRSLGHSGTKLNTQYSTNSVHVVRGTGKGAMKSHSNNVSLGVVQPWVVNEKTRSEATFDISHQNSKTSFEEMSLYNYTTRNMSVGFNMTNYGKTHIFYQNHKLNYGREYDKGFTGHESNDFFFYKGVGLYQKGYQHGQSVLVKTELQMSANSDVASSQSFYIGGVYSVRGYKENFTGGNSGYTFSAEYSVPIVKDKTVSAFTFFDYGNTELNHKEGAQSGNWYHVLASTGVGIKATIAKQYFASLTLGCPLRREWEVNKPSKTRLHFTVSGQF